MRQQTERIKEIEQELAEWDLKYAKRVNETNLSFEVTKNESKLTKEEFWHKKYNEQLKVVFNKQQSENATAVSIGKQGLNEWNDPLAKLGERREDPLDQRREINNSGQKDAKGGTKNVVLKTQPTMVNGDQNVSIRELNELKERIMFLEDEVTNN